MNITTISKRLGKGIAQPYKVCIRKWLFPILSLSDKDDDAILFFLYKKQEEPCLITGNNEVTHSILMERVIYASVGDRMILLEGCLWTQRKAIVFSEPSVKVDTVCLLQKMLDRYENIDISNYTVYSSNSKGYVFSTPITNLYAEESVCNIDK